MHMTSSTSGSAAKTQLPSSVLDNEEAPKGVKRKVPEPRMEQRNATQAAPTLADSGGAARQPKRARREDAQPSPHAQRMPSSPPAVVPLAPPPTSMEWEIRRESTPGLLCTRILGKVDLARKMTTKLPYGSSHVKPAAESIKVAVAKLLERGEDSAGSAETCSAFQELETGVRQWMSAVQSLESCGKYADSVNELKKLLEGCPAAMRELRFRFRIAEHPDPGSAQGAELAPAAKAVIAARLRNADEVAAIRAAAGKITRLIASLEAARRSWPKSKVGSKVGAQLEILQGQWEIVRPALAVEDKSRQSLEAIRLMLAAVIALKERVLQVVRKQGTAAALSSNDPATGVTMVDEISSCFEQLRALLKN